MQETKHHWNSSQHSNTSSKRISYANYKAHILNLPNQAGHPTNFGIYPKKFHSKINLKIEKVWNTVIAPYQSVISNRAIDAQ